MEELLQEELQVNQANSSDTVVAEENYIDISPKRINYTQLSKLTGLSARHITRVLKGQCKSPSFTVISKIAEGMEVSPEEVIEYIEDNKVKSQYNGGRVLSEIEVKNIVDLKEIDGMTTRKAAKLSGVSRQTISNIWTSKEK